MGNSETGLTSLYLYHLLSAYTHLGCWKDTARRAVPQIEGSDPRIRGNYVRRGDAINKCYQVARQRKMVIFAVQNGGWCAAAGNLNGYRKYGKASNCKNGKGGPWANDVYRITNPIRPALPKGIFTVETHAMGVTLIRIIISLHSTGLHKSLIISKSRPGMSIKNVDFRNLC